MEIFQLLAGLAIIVKSADVLIDSSSKIARKYGVSSFVIGITVIAFGTSAPEAVVGLLSAVNKTNQLTLGNIIGSAYANTALIVGIAAAILPLTVKNSVIKREIPMLIFVQCILAFMILADNKLTRLEGIILLAGFAGFIAYIIIDSKKSHTIPIDSEGGIDTDESELAEKAGVKVAKFAKLWVYGGLSLIGLFIGGKLAVDSSTQIAVNFGLNETIIGLSVVALATTLPELMTSVMAVRKNEPDIVLGNCIGSNLFNILSVLGLSAAINPISTQGDMLFDVLFMIALTVVIFAVSFFAKRVTRLTGILLIISYISYVGVKVITALNVF